MGLLPLYGMLSPLGMGAGKAAAAPWWLAGGISAANCVAAFQPKGAASLAASYVNLANPGVHDAFLGVAPTLSSGWVFNGTTQYLKTDIVPTATGALIVQFAGVSNNGCVAGGGAAYNYYLFPALASKVYYGFGNFAGSVSPSLSAGNIALAGHYGYRNGVLDTTEIDTLIRGAVASYIGARNTGTGFDFPCAGTVKAIACYDPAPTAGQMLILAAAMAAL